VAKNLENEYNITITLVIPQGMSDSNSNSNIRLIKTDRTQLVDK